MRTNRGFGRGGVTRPPRYGPVLACWAGPERCPEQEKQREIAPACAAPTGERLRSLSFRGRHEARRCSCRLPGAVKVTRNRVMSRGASGAPIVSWFGTPMKPEFMLSFGELSIACRTPSSSKVTPGDGGISLKGSVPNVTVWNGRRGPVGPFDRVADVDDRFLAEEAHDRDGLRASPVRVDRPPGRP